MRLGCSGADGSIVSVRSLNEEVTGQLSLCLYEGKQGSWECMSQKQRDGGRIFAALIELAPLWGGFIGRFGLRFILILLIFVFSLFRFRGKKIGKERFDACAECDQEASRVRSSSWGFGGESPTSIGPQQQCLQETAPGYAQASTLRPGEPLQNALRPNV